MSWFGLGLFAAVFWLCETVLYLNGYDTYVYTHKTEVEKQFQQLKLEKLKNEQTK